MTVEKLINVLSKEVKKCDRKTSKIEIWQGEQEYVIDSMEGFSLSPDVVINIKPIQSPIMRPATFKQEHKKMISDKVKEIQSAMTKDQIAAAKVILKYRGKKVKWSMVYYEVGKVAPGFDYSDFCRLTKITTKNLKSMIKG